MGAVARRELGLSPVGRPSGSTGIRLTEEHRSKIANSQILNALIEHVEGKREMTGTQVSAGIALLRKVLPDLSTTTVTGDADNPLVHIHRIVLVGKAPENT